MQTFLPYPAFNSLAIDLDDMRLGKQRVEAMQILQVITGVRLDNTYRLETTGRLRNRYHPDGRHEVYEVTRRVDNPRSEWQYNPVTPGWANHPATLMWEDCGHFLLDYVDAICREWMRRGFVDTVLGKCHALVENTAKPLRLSAPTWWGTEQADEVFASHRGSLYRKNPGHYPSAWASDAADFPEYVWPKTVPEVIKF